MKKPSSRSKPDTSFLRPPHRRTSWRKVSAETRRSRDRATRPVANHASVSDLISSSGRSTTSGKRLDSSSTVAGVGSGETYTGLIRPAGSFDPLRTPVSAFSPCTGHCGWRNRASDLH